MEHNKVDNILNVICPNCKTYVIYTKEEMNEMIKNKKLTCKLCNNNIPIKIEVK